MRVEEMGAQVGVEVDMVHILGDLLLLYPEDSNKEKQLLHKEMQE